LHVVYDDDVDPFQVVMQVEGAALQARSDRVKTAIASIPQVQSILVRYARAFAIQVATTAQANGRANLDERLARWLLMVGDRVGSTFPITHEFISIMLGVRRPGVTVAVQTLEGIGLIRATRGAVTILDRKGLVALANASYGFAEAHYVRLLGQPR
jgi:CRP-like cAMP-binding protein